MDILFSPPFALPIYILLVGVLVIIGRKLAGTSSTSGTDSSIYASGEAPPENTNVVPGYRPFFVVALFFAMLHLGVVILSTGTMSGITVLYLLGLMAVLVALILG